MGDLLHQQRLLTLLLRKLGFKLLDLLEQAEVLFDFDFVEVVEPVVLLQDFAVESALVARVLLADHQLQLLQLFLDGLIAQRKPLGLHGLQQISQNALFFFQPNASMLLCLQL